jgi:hypothetical protein
MAIHFEANVVRHKEMEDYFTVMEKKNKHTIMTINVF